MAASAVSPRAVCGGVTDLRRHWSRSPTAAWDVVTDWEPRTCPLPKDVFRALFASTLLTLDVPFGVQTVVGFVGGLRPGEGLRLRRSDIVLPVDRGRVDGPAYIVVGNLGKARGRRSRRVQAQHTKIGDPVMVHLLTWSLADLPPAS